jgi:hypothetical protein
MPQGHSRGANSQRCDTSRSTPSEYLQKVARRAFSNLWNFSVVIVDPLLEAAHAGIGEAAIAAVLSMIPKGTRA